MKRLINLISFCFLFLIVGCSSISFQSNKYTVSQRFTLASMTRDNEVSLPFADNICYDGGLRFYMTFDGIKAIIGIQNDSGNSVKVLWDDGAFVDQNNIAHRIVHAGIKITDKEKAQVPSVIPDESMIDDTIYAADCLRWNSKKGDWDYLPIVWDRMFANEEDANRYIQNMAPVKLLLPIERNGQITEYLFTFKEKNSSLTSRKGIKINPTHVTIGAIAIIVIAYVLGRSDSQ